MPVWGFLLILLLLFIEFYLGYLNRKLRKSIDLLIGYTNSVSDAAERMAPIVQRSDDKDAQAALDQLIMSNRHGEYVNDQIRKKRRPQ